MTQSTLDAPLRVEVQARLELKGKIQASGQDLRFIPTLFQVNEDRAFTAAYPAAPDETKLRVCQ